MLVYCPLLHASLFDVARLLIATPLDAMALDTFLAFLGRRVAAFTAEAELTLRDVRETHAGDELYSKADVEAMFDEAQVAVRVRRRGRRGLREAGKRGRPPRVL